MEFTKPNIFKSDKTYLPEWCLNIGTMAANKKKSSSIDVIELKSR